LNKPLLISTGTCGLDELSPAADVLAAHAPGGALLQCVSSYPTPPETAALGGIAALAAQFNLPVGYSDHTTLETTAGLAVAAGACVLEKHLTYDRDAAGPDHAASLDPGQFKSYVDHARETAAMLGSTRKAPLDVENDVAAVSRQSVCAARDLPAGHVLEQSDLTIKRPGTGIAAAQLSKLIGKQLLHAVQANTLLQWADVQRD
jgi:sialic acid synthase SpsE